MHDTPSRPSRGLARVDLTALLGAAAVFAACVLPALARGKGDAHVAQSLANLALLGAAHAVYAADWNDRQPTFIQDDMAAFGDTLVTAFDGWTEANGGYGDPDNWHPPITFGWGPDLAGTISLFAWRCDGNTANESLHVPIGFVGGVTYFGSFRMTNTRQFRQYVASRFYDPVFYAPGDAVPFAHAEPLFSEPWEYVWTPPTEGFGDAPYWSSYCWSPAGMYDPAVMRHPDQGGWIDPWLIDEGMRSPSFSAARHPALKSLLMEHSWIQHPPAPCNPIFPFGFYGPCEPYFYNHGLASRPATLFHDLSTTLLANQEVQAADQAMIARTGYGLWSRDTAFGANGYLIAGSYDAVDLSHHVLTTDGILGRDRLGR